MLILISEEDFKYFQQGLGKVSIDWKLVAFLWLCSSEGKIRILEKCLSHPADRNETDFVWQTAVCHRLEQCECYFIKENFSSELWLLFTDSLCASSVGIQLTPVFYLTCSFYTRWNTKILLWDWCLRDMDHFPGWCQRHI